MKKNLALFLLLAILSSNPPIFSSEPSTKNITFEEESVKIEKQKKIKSEFGKQRLSSSSVQILAKSGLFSDISHSLKTLPGVVSNGDFSAEMYIRGGGSDEVITVIDQHYVDANKLFGGRISRINPKIVENITLYTGGFPARYGKVLSGIVDVTYKKGDLNNWHADLDQSMTDLNYLIHGPIQKGESSILFAYRRTYYDMLAKLFLSPNTQIPYFQSLYTKAYFKLDSKKSLTLTYDLGNDGANMQGDDFKSFSGNGGRLVYDQSLNSLFVTFENVFSSDLKSTLLAGIDKDTLSGDFGVDTTIGNISAQVNKRMLPITLGNEWTYKISQHTLNSGLYYYSWRVNTNQIVTLPRDPRYPNSSKTIDVTNLENRSTYYAVFLQDEISLIPKKLSLNAGLRYETVPNMSKAKSFQPRLNLYVGDRERTSLSFSVGSYSDFLFISPENEALTGFDLEPRKVMQYGIGIEHHQGGQYFLRSELFYKNYDRLIFPTPAHPLTGISSGYENSGRGYAYGIELFLQRLEKKTEPRNWDGYLSYTLSLAKQYSPERQWFYPAHDQRHTFNAVGGYRWSPLWKLMTLISLSSGKPYTDISGARFDAVNNVYIPHEQGYNSARIPIYAKVDLWFEFAQPTWPFYKWFSGKTYFGISNLFNNENISSYYWNDDYSKKTGIKQFPRMPIFGTQIIF